MNPHLAIARTPACREAGMSLVELMIGMMLGILLLLGIVNAFERANRTSTAIQRSSQQIDNGQYALQLIGNELHDAGFYGPFYTLPNTPAALPAACNTTDLVALYDALALPVQGYPAPNLTSKPALPADCAAFGLTSANVVAGSDVLLVRRADTSVLTSAPAPNEIYLQANTTTAAVQLGVATGFALGQLNADNSVAVVGTDATGNAATILKRANVAGASPVVDAGRIAADIRKLHVSIYFVAPCSVPADGTNVCTGASDDDGTPIPTLKRLDLVAEGGATTMRVDALVEGAERFTLDYGIDSAPATVNEVTNFVGDGVPDGVSRTLAVADWANVVTAQVHLVSRALTQTPGYSDAKTYAMGAIGTTAATSDAYTRHVFAQSITLNNQSQRRQIPE